MSEYVKMIAKQISNMNTLKNNLNESNFNEAYDSSVYKIGSEILKKISGIVYDPELNETLSGFVDREIVSALRQKWIHRKLEKYAKELSEPAGLKTLSYSLRDLLETVNDSVIHRRYKIKLVRFILAFSSPETIKYIERDLYTLFMINSVDDVNFNIKFPDGEVVDFNPVKDGDNFREKLFSKFKSVLS